MRISAIILSLLCAVPSLEAFVPASQLAARRGCVGEGSSFNAIGTPDEQFQTMNGPEPDKDTKLTEKRLRKEIAERNSVVENEEKYAVLDGESMTNMDQPTAEEESAASLSITDDYKALEAKLQRLIKPRAYPLFLAEKAAEIAEGVVAEFSKPEKSFPKSGTKEKVVVLGTGWGAASFLKDIDTDLYDVTVISPRNYFLFTPMLAGASVGTVEYRSITEPVREVSPKKKTRNHYPHEKSGCTIQKTDF